MSEEGQPLSQEPGSRKRLNILHERGLAERAEEHEPNEQHQTDLRRIDTRLGFIAHASASKEDRQEAKNIVGKSGYEDVGLTDEEYSAMQSVWAKFDKWQATEERIDEIERDATKGTRSI